MRAWVILLPFFLSGCMATRLRHEVGQLERDFQQHTGFALYDVKKKKSVFQYRADKYYTPASNTKILTLFTALQVLGDSAIAFRYQYRHDTLVVWGMGDPSFLNPFTASSSRAYQLLAQHTGPLIFSQAHFQEEVLGPGWAWNDSQYSYQPERSALPVYSNLMRLKKKGPELTVQPVPLSKDVIPMPGSHNPQVIRSAEGTPIWVYAGPAYLLGQWIPFRTSEDVLAELLGDTLKRAVAFARLPLPPDAQVFYSVPTDSLYRVMMQESDNFLAEQILLQCAGVLHDTLRAQIAIDYAQRFLMQDLPDPPKWVDGSGLSRYNLMTPRSIVRLWEKIWHLRSSERLLPLLATGGVNGTTKSWYAGDPDPYLFGKTGTLRHTHALSGYLITKRKRVLIFSFMHNHYPVSAQEVRARMQTILALIRDRY